MTLAKDARHALRMFARTPGFTLVAVVTLGVGIGMSVAVWSVVDAVLIDPLPVPDSARLVELRTMDPGHVGRGFPSTSPDYREWAERNQSFEAMAATFRENVSLTGGDEPERISGTRATATFFDVVGVTPSLGRAFRPEEDQSSDDLVVVLSHGLWQRRFAADAGVLGTTVTLDGRPRVVVGVMPEGFSFPGDTEAWLPMAFDWSQEHRGRGYVVPYGRLRDGVTLEEAQADLDRIAAWQQRQFPDTNEGVWVRAVPAKEMVVGDVRPALLVLLAAVTGVLLIAVGNVAILQSVRTVARRREVALRQALGARRSRLVRQLLTESTLLALAGGVLGVLLAYLATRLVSLGFAPFVPRRGEIGVDLDVLVFAVVLSLAVGLMVGSVTVVRTRDERIMARLRETDPAVVGRRPAGTALIVAEIAVSVVLVAGAALLGRTFLNLMGVDPGFDGEGVLSLEVTLTADRYRDASDRVAFLQRATAEIESLPGVASVGTVYPLPLQGRLISAYPFVEGLSDPESAEQTLVQQRFASPGYLETVGLRLVEGRFLEPSDVADAPAVVVVNESFVRRLVPDGDAIGRRLTKDLDPEDPAASWATIVGVVEDVRHRDLAVGGDPELYLPVAQNALPWVTFVVRGRGDAPALAAPVRTAIRRVDPDLPVFNVRPLRDVIVDSIAGTWLLTSLVTLFAAVALALAGVGVFSVVSFSIGRRVREVAIRMAIGASRQEVLGLVLRQALAPVALGAALGVTGGMAVMRLLASELYGVAAHDPTTHLGAATVLVAVGVLATWLPARRAARIDPMTVLRTE